MPNLVSRLYPATTDLKPLLGTYVNRRSSLTLGDTVSGSQV